jgi:hypothetical protein
MFGLLANFSEITLALLIKMSYIEDNNLKRGDLGTPVCQLQLAIVEHLDVMAAISQL